MAEQKASKREDRARSQLSSMQVMFAAILAVGLLLAINFSTRIAAGQPLQAAYGTINTEIEELRQEQARLIVQRDYVQSDAYVANWARDEGKMVRQGEVLVIPVPSGETFEPTPIPTLDIPVETAPPESASWQLWWSLFFDGEPPPLPF